MPTDVRPWSVIEFSGKFRTTDELDIRFKIGEDHWCNSTDFMVPWHRSLSKNSYDFENCTVLKQLPGYYNITA